MVGLGGDTLIPALVQVAMEHPEGGELIPVGDDPLDKGVVIRRRAPVGEGDGPFEGEVVGQAPNADDGVFKGHLPAQSIDTGAQGRHVGETAREGIISSDGERPTGAKTAQGSQSFLRRPLGLGDPTGKGQGITGGAQAEVLVRVFEGFGEDGDAAEH